MFAGTNAKVVDEVEEDSSAVNEVKVKVTADTLSPRRLLQSLKLQL